MCVCMCLQKRQNLAHKDDPWENIRISRWIYLKMSECRKLLSKEITSKCNLYVELDDNFHHFTLEDPRKENIDLSLAHLTGYYIDHAL